ncbi:MAG TPA: spore coat U domain-containing protein [Azospirillum sp.]|nr:spore coat U domain-containing protein [Azospirillum sp.]
MHTLMMRTLLLLAALSPVPAAADCLLCVCTANTGNLNFGNYNPLSAAPLDDVATVRVRCSLAGTGVLPALVSYDIGLSAGSSGSTNPREMRLDGERLLYNLYSDAARTQVWGEAGSSSQLTVSYGTALLGTWVQSDVYGRIFARQYPAPGRYTDSIVVTVSY